MCWQDSPLLASSPHSVWLTLTLPAVPLSKVTWCLYPHRNTTAAYLKKKNPNSSLFILNNNVWNLLSSKQQGYLSFFLYPQSKEHKWEAAGLKHDCSKHRFSLCGIDSCFIQGCAVVSGLNAEEVLQHNLSLCFYVNVREWCIKVNNSWAEIQIMLRFEVINTGFSLTGLVSLRNLYL